MMLDRGSTTRAAATILPVWLHIAWMTMWIPRYGSRLSENLLGLMAGLWFLPIGLTLCGCLKGWIPQRGCWLAIVLPYAVLLIGWTFILPD